MAFSDQNKILKKNYKAGQHLTTGHWFLLDYSLAMLFCYTILPLKLEVTWSHIEGKKTLLQLHHKVFQLVTNYYCQQNRKIIWISLLKKQQQQQLPNKKYMIACFINSLCKFNNTFQKTQKRFSLQPTIFLANLRFFFEAIFVSKFWPCLNY